jgi:hypothetical protein
VLCVVVRAGPDGIYNRDDLVAVDVPSGSVRPVTAVAPGNTWASRPGTQPAAL